MTLAPAFLDELRARTTLSTLIGRTVKVTKAGREFKACCPFHNEKTPSFTINDDKGFYHCFGCGAHGDAIRWMTDQRGLPFMDAVKELAAGAGMEVPAADPRAAERAERASSLYDVMTAAAAWFTEQLVSIGGAEANAYLKQRGLDAATIKDFGIGFAPDTRGKLRSALAKFGDDTLIEAGLLISVEEKEPYDRFRGRLMIPIRDPRGRVIAFGGRILGAGEPKYLNSPDTPLFDKGRTLYNLDRAGAAARKSGRVIVVEGYMDVIALAQAGLEDVVAPLGTALTEMQMEVLWRFTETPLMCFDGDKAGESAATRAAQRALPVLIPGRSLNFVSLPSGLDPDDVIRRYGIAKLEEFLETPETMIARLWRTECAKHPLETPEKRSGLQERLDDLAKTVKNSIVASEYRNSFRQIFFQQFRLSKKQRDEIRGDMSAYRTQRKKSILDLSDAFVKALLLGLMRYTDVLVQNLSEIQQLQIQNEYLGRWRNRLVEAASTIPYLDEDIINTILSDSDVSPIEKRDIQKDLAYSFYYREHERARDELRDIIRTLLDEENVDRALKEALTRFEMSQNIKDWDALLGLKKEAALFEKQRQDLLEELRAAA